MRNLKEQAEKKRGLVLKVTLKNLLTSEEIKVHPSTDHPHCSYGQPVWVDDNGNAYGLCDMGAPLGFELIQDAHRD